MKIISPVLMLIAVGPLLCGQQRASSDTPVEYSHAPDLRNVSYGPHERNVLDLWKAKSGRPTPVVIYFHPGAFSHGDKTGMEKLDGPLLELCLKKGISVATANYRYADRTVHLPVPMFDGARVVQFIRLHAREWNLNPQAFAVAGGSSGAGMALWIGFHDDLANPASGDPVERQSSRVAVIGSVDGQTSYDPWVIAKIVDERIMMSPVIPGIFGAKGEELKTQTSRELFAISSPVTHLKSGAPPVFLYYTQNIKPLPPANQSEMIHNPRFGLFLKEKMDALGIECVFRTPKDYPDGGQRPFTGEMVDFFLKRFGSLYNGPTDTRKGP